MFRRILIFKGVFASSVLFCIVALFVYGTIDHVEQLQTNPRLIGQQIAQEMIGRFQWPVLIGSLALATWLAFGDLMSRSKGKRSLPTYSDGEFIAKFGGKVPNSE